MHTCCHTQKASVSDGSGTISLMPFSPAWLLAPGKDPCKETVEKVVTLHPGQIHCKFQVCRNFQPRKGKAAPRQNHASSHRWHKMLVAAS